MRLPRAVGRRRPSIAWWWSAAVVCVPALVATDASGQERVPVRITFAGAPGCNDPAQLEREIARRTENVAVTADSEADTSIDVRVANGVDRVDAVLIVDRANQQRVTRAVSGLTCAEVIEATALIIAVLVASPPEAEQPPPPPPPEPPPPPPPEPPPPPPPEPPPEPLAWRFGAGASGALRFGLAPGALPGAEPFVELATWRQGWSPAFRLGVRHSWREDFEVAGSPVSFQLTSATAALCPLAWLPMRRIAARPCLMASFGSLEASSYQSERHPWLGLGGGIRLEAELHRVVVLELAGAAEATAIKSSFYLDFERFHAAAPVTGWVGVGLAAKFP